MAVSPLRQDVGLTVPALTSYLPSTSALLPETGGFEALDHLVGNVWCGKSQCGEEGKPPEELQVSLWQDFFSDPREWWDNRRSKPTSRHPDFKHKKSKFALWLNNRHKPAWVDSQLATLDARLRRPSECVRTSVQGKGAFAADEDHLEIGMCIKLCEDGRTTDALDAVRLLVQRGCHVPSNLFYRMLKRCMAQKDLVLARRVHALTIESGYEGDAYLATHLIGLYASHGRLGEAMQVFSEVSKLNAYVWAAIIFAHARHGQAGQAIQLYRQMRESTVKPDNRIYVAVVKACATVGDLVAGKEVHDHILASPVSPDIFVQTSLLAMYAKCGSLQDARRIFDSLSHRNVVTWTAMIAGYAQQGMGQEALGLYNSMQQEGLAPPDSVTFTCLLQACASVGVDALYKGKQLHAQIDEQGLQEDVVLGGGLVNMYAKCGSLADARRVFDRLAYRNVVTWTAMIAGYAQQGMGQEALSLYSSMQHEGLSFPRAATFVCLLQACASLGAGALSEGKKLHAEIKELGLLDDVVLGGSLVNMYVKCGSLEDARSLFDRLPDRNVVTWTAMMSGYSQQGMGREALSLYNGFGQEGLCPPDSVTFATLLQACANVGVGALHEGEQLHAQIKERGLQDDVFLGGSLVNMYAKCGSLKDARSMFDRLPAKNVMTWNAMLAGYTQHGMGQESLILYNVMQQECLSPPDSGTYICLLQACASIGVAALHVGKQLHRQIEERGLQADVVLGCSLVNMYAKCDSLEDAGNVFHRLPERDVVTWTAIIAGYAQQGRGEEALSLYSSMQQEGLSPPDSVTLVCLLQACASLGVGALQEGRQLHAQIAKRGLQNDVALGCSLVNMYASCGSLEDARKVFDGLPDRDAVTWTSMISGYAQLGMGQEALGLYSSMQQEGMCPHSVTFVCVLQACASVGVDALYQGKQLHAQIEEQGLQDDVVLGCSLINMYAKCGSLEDARKVFDTLPERDVVTWTAMIAGYAQQGMGQEALRLYSSMQQEGLSPASSITFVCLLQACAFLAGLPLGKQLHADIEKQGMHADVVVGAALVNMYAKCGSMFDSQQVFDSLPEKPVEAWSALIGGYTRQGSSNVVFDLLDRMMLEGTQPNGITFLSVLTVCSHVGLVDKGRKYFEAMRTDYGISPSVEHYTCMMDLLGRAGHLKEALQMAKTLPFPANSTVWHTLLGACRKWHNVEIAEQAFDLAVRLDEKDAPSYVLMSNIYARAQLWEDAKKIQARRKKCGAWKEPGQCWWTDTGGVVHTFVVGETYLSESAGVDGGPEQPVRRMIKEGHGLHEAVGDIPDDELEAEFCANSEKLASLML